ncbi:UDP-4-amino-4,6-dideoxy-N-acetyl-beta-L-altrosamine transaminase [Alteromonas sp. ASW11-19]|uniref:UDP-4-amino-4, 6-dideoxy-N-acetyl-beta-L-altrosamine transaminase n=1 Tax=Alteromonas salexigens TaxID=2982530 RepID=A0ABT2VPF9_9ALTE|nr:UDP-4-amino-4,6-dideoxy-N-acetyl-beta-L-altrosamine transaminase [Alteromonas salexigens]MCU7554985.1 UDP-4-amino-4,6-dideoxy-N-acetyl-beta-L-altrosamine transaminase [Alteromonas salexigens]
MIPYGRHSVNRDDIDAVVDVLENEFLTQGSQVPAFERVLCEYTGARYAIACNSGTSGLHLACMAAQVEPGDLVWTSPNSFAASANCARYCGADVDFVDIDPATRNLCLQQLSDKLSAARAAGRLPKVIIAVHFAGSSCDMKAIKELIAQDNIFLIEDAAHGLGGRDAQGRPIGSTAHSDMTILSFHPVKSMTTAEGGAVLTNDSALADRVRLHASHGITRDPTQFPEDEQAHSWFYAQQSLGYNYRLSDLHAALGNSQIHRLDGFIKARRELAGNYQQQLRDLPVRLPAFDANSAWHLYVVELTKHNRASVFNALRERDIGVNVHYIPIYKHPYYQRLGFQSKHYPNCEKYYQSAITLPLFPEMSADMQNKVVSTMHEVLA